MILTHRLSLGSRLVRLQGQVEALPRPPQESPDEDDWLAIFEGLSRDGAFKYEPDFPVALNLFREALARAHASTDPRFDPPSDFQPWHQHQYLRRECWRTGGRFPDLDEAFMWLGEMHRVHNGIPPVSEVEFHELAEWFAANEIRLRQLALPSGLFSLSNGRQPSCSDIRYDLAKGPRMEGAGQVAEDVRQLQRLFARS